MTPVPWITNKGGYLIHAKSRVIQELRTGGFDIQRGQIVSVLVRWLEVCQKWVIHIRGFCETFLISVSLPAQLAHQFNLLSWKITFEWMEGGKLTAGRYPRAPAYLRKAEAQGRLVRVPGYSFTASTLKTQVIDEEAKACVDEAVSKYSELDGCFDKWKISSDTNPVLDKDGLSKNQALQLQPPIQPSVGMRKKGFSPAQLLTMMVMMRALKSPRMESEPVIFSGVHYDERNEVPLGNKSAGQVPNVAGIGIRSKREMPVMVQLLIQQAHVLGKAFMQPIKYAEKLEIIKKMKDQPRCIYADTVLSSYVMQSMFPQIHAEKNIFLGDGTSSSWMGGNFYNMLFRLTDYLPDAAPMKERMDECARRGAHTSDKKGWDHRVSMLLKAYGLTALAATTEFDNFFVAVGAEVFASVICPLIGVSYDVAVMLYNLLSSGIPLTLLLNTLTHDATTDSFTIAALYHKDKAVDYLPTFDFRELEILNCNIKVGDDYLGVWNLYAPYLDRFIDSVWGCVTETAEKGNPVFELCQRYMDFENRTLKKDPSRTVGRMGIAPSSAEVLIESAKSAALGANQKIVCEVARDIAFAQRHRCGMVDPDSSHFLAEVRCGTGAFNPDVVDFVYRPAHDFVKKSLMERRAAREYGMSLDVLKACFGME